MRASPPRADAAGGRRWVRRLLFVVVVATGAAALRERKLAANTRRFDLPG